MSLSTIVPSAGYSTKDTNPNPKDFLGVSKWGPFHVLPMTVMTEVATGMGEGGMKYGSHNYRVAGVRSSVYVDAAFRHIVQYWEGEDVDADSGLSHITKAICSLVVLRDAMIQDMLTDDRPPKGNIAQVRNEMQATMDSLKAKYPDPVPPFTEEGKQ